jgi:antitoxin YefM
VDTMSYTVLRNHLAMALSKVNKDHKPILITRQNGAAAVLLSLEDFQSYEATAYLMMSVKNAERLNQAIDELESDGGAQRNLLEE